MRILFITSNRIGDAVLTTGVLAEFANKYPEAQFTVACGPVAADLFRAVPRLEKLIVLHKKSWNRHWLGLWKECAGTQWDLIADFRNSIVSRLLRAKTRAYPHASKPGQHKVITNAAALGMETPPSPHIWLDKAAEEAAAQKILNGAPVLAFGPAANWPAKQWPIEKFVLLMRALTASHGPVPGAHVLVAAAPHEREQVSSLLDALPSNRKIDAIGYDLLTVAACLKRCRLFIGNDSGLMHIAAAVGTPTLGLFGPGFEDIYGPWGKHTAVARTPESAKELLARLSHHGANEPNLMESLSVEAVYETAKGLLAIR